MIRRFFADKATAKTYLQVGEGQSEAAGADLWGVRVVRVRCRRWRLEAQGRTGDRDGGGNEDGVFGDGRRAEFHSKGK